MTTTEQIQALNEAVSQLQLQVSSIANQLSSNSNSLGLHIADCEDDINTINGRLGLLSNEDIDIHEEIHDVALVVDEHTAILNNLGVDLAGHGDDIEDLQEADESLQAQINDMDEEHHEELHTLALAVDGHTAQINSLELFKAETPEHVVLSESEYEALGNPDFDTFYFTYEED